MVRYIEWHIYKRRVCRNARKITIDKAPSDGRCSSWNLKAFVRRNWRRACFLNTNKWNSIHWSNLIGVSDRQTPFLFGNILQQNGERAGRHYPPAIFVAGAQRDARVLHCKNPVHSPSTPRRLNGYPGWKTIVRFETLSHPLWRHCNVIIHARVKVNSCFQ